MERFIARSAKSGLIPTAYAANLPAFCNEPVPQLELKVEYLEYLFDYLQQCYLAEKMALAHIRIETAGGFREKLLGYMDLAKYRTLSTLAMDARSIVSMANCVDGFLTGGNSSGTGMVCDFISGFLMYGDIRDFVIHGYHLHFGDAGKFDNATYTLAGLGMVTNLLQVGGFIAGAAPGVAMTGADGAVAGAKLAVKVFRRGGQASKYIHLLTDFLSKNVMEIPENLQKAQNLVKVMPLLEVTAMICFYQDEFGEVGELLMDMVQTEGAFLNLVSYVHGYFEWHAQQSTTTGDGRDFRLVEEAYAAPPIRASVRKVLQNLRAYKVFIESLGIEGSEEIGQMLAKTISELEIAKNPTASVKVWTRTSSRTSTAMR
jgi:hypothetical protein